MAKKKAKKKSKKKAKKKAQRVVETEPEPMPEQQEVEKSQAPAAEPVSVKLTGPFGSVVAQVSGIFRDGMCLVLYSDARQLAALYEPPDAAEPMPLMVEFEQHRVECVWAGIQFTMPSTPVKFIVLLVVEETSAQADNDAP